MTNGQRMGLRDPPRTDQGGFRWPYLARPPKRQVNVASDRTSIDPNHRIRELLATVAKGAGRGPHPIESLPEALRTPDLLGEAEALDLIDLVCRYRQKFAIARGDGPAETLSGAYVWLSRDRMALDGPLVEALARSGRKPPMERLHVQLTARGRQILVAGDEGQPRQENTGAGEQVSWQGRAIGLRHDNPSISIEAVAELVGKDKGTVYREAQQNPEFAQKMGINPRNRGAPKGSVSPDSGIDAEAPRGYNAQDAVIDLAEKLERGQDAAAKSRATPGATPKKE